VDEAFFRIVRRFGLLIAFLALTGTVGAIAWGIVLCQTRVHDAIATLKFDYENFKQSLRPVPANQEQAPPQVREARPVSPVVLSKSAFEREFDGYLRQIVANGNKYLSPEFTIEEEAIRSTCNQLVDQFPEPQHDELGLAFVAQFAEISKGFAEDPANKQNLSDPTENAQRWENFASSFGTELQTQIAAENERVQKETAEAVVKKAQALQLMEAAGVAFIVFAFFTLMLVLMSKDSAATSVDILI
jgi:hypothetical protein